MTVRAYIRENRSEIDAYIRGRFDKGQRVNDQEREMWVRNDEVLWTDYVMASAMQEGR